MEREEIKELKRELELTKQSLDIAKKALSDIVNWNEEMEDEWSDQGDRSARALQLIQTIESL